MQSPYCVHVLGLHNLEIERDDQAARWKSRDCANC